MAHEKLSPRQKMIGMMYLVLTAMLALNVQKEVVKAFMKVDKGLSTTVENYVQKNNFIYNEFEASYAQFPEKTGPYRAKALEVKQRSDEMYNFIQDLKIIIIREADGEDAVAINGRNIDIEKVVKYDENNIPSQILVGANEDGKAYDLMAALNDYRDFMIGVLEGKNSAIEESLKKTLNTDKAPGEDKTMEPWPNVTFQLMPLVGANALLTKMQVDVRNAETEVINHLYGQIDKASFKFNKVDAVVIPKSTYVTQGSNYEASVFVSATDSTQAPVIAVGDQVLPLDEAGRGVYSVKATGTPGPRKYNGIISLKAPDGTTQTFDFNSEYSVGEPNVVVSPTAMNVMYASIANPIDISVPGVGSDRIRIKVNNGTWSTEKVKNPKGENFPGNWSVVPEAANKNVQILVSTEVDGKTTTYPAKEFRVKDLPSPIAQLAGKNTGTIDKNTLMAQKGIIAILPESDFYIQYNVTGFSVFYTDNMGDNSEPSETWTFTERQKTILNRLTRGRTLFITNIRAVGPDKKTRELPAISLKIN